MDFPPTPLTNQGQVDSLLSLLKDSLLAAVQTGRAIVLQRKMYLGQQNNYQGSQFIISIGQVEEGGPPHALAGIVQGQPSQQPPASRGPGPQTWGSA